MTSRLLILASCLLVGPTVNSWAGTVGFNGPWRPIDSGGSYINGFSPFITGPGQYLTTSLSPDKSTLTIDFYNPDDSDGSIFFQNYSGLLPAGTVSYDWSIELFSDGFWEYEAGVSGGLVGSYSAGVYTGSLNVSYPVAGLGNYFSYGNIRFYGGQGTAHAQVVLTNFNYSPVVPEPSTGLLAVGALAAWAGQRKLMKR